MSIYIITNNALKTPSIFYVLPLLLNFQVIMNFVWKFFSKSKLCHGLNVNSLPCFPFLHSRHSSRSSKSLKYWKSHIKIYGNFFCPWDIRPNLLSPLILKTRQHILFPDPQKSTSHSCPGRLANTSQVQCSKEKFLYSAQKQTWIIIKRTLSIWIIIIWQYSGDAWCGHGPMGGHSGEGGAQGCQVDF